MNAWTETKQSRVNIRLLTYSKLIDQSSVWISMSVKKSRIMGHSYLIRLDGRMDTGQQEQENKTRFQKFQKTLEPEQAAC